MDPSFRFTVVKAEKITSTPHDHHDHLDQEHLSLLLINILYLRFLSFPSTLMDGIYLFVLFLTFIMDSDL